MLSQRTSAIGKVLLQTNLFATFLRATERDSAYAIVLCSFEVQNDQFSHAHAAYQYGALL